MYPLYQYEKDNYGATAAQNQSTQGSNSRLLLFQNSSSQTKISQSRKKLEMLQVIYQSTPPLLLHTLKTYIQQHHHPHHPPLTAPSTSQTERQTDRPFSTLPPTIHHPGKPLVQRLLLRLAVLSRHCLLRRALARYARQRGREPSRGRRRSRLMRRYRGRV